MADRGRFTFAVSGGHTPWAMFAELANEDMPWADVELFQVDERVAPDGDPDRNLTHLRESIGDAPARVHPMPVNDPDLDAAAAAYATVLPQRFDLVHLGLGPDGHTASLVPGDPVLEVTDALVGGHSAVSGPPADDAHLPRARPAPTSCCGWSPARTSGSALAKLLAGDESIPAGRVLATRSLVMADESAAAEPPARTRPPPIAATPRRSRTS